jgi:Protein of unknown function (DUF4054)
MNPAILTYNDALFRVQIPAYAAIPPYSEAILQGWWDVAINYVSDQGNFGSLQDGKRQYAINLMMAHLIYIQNLIASGTVPYLMQNSTIDKVSVGLTPPPIPNQWRWWMMVSPYGQMLLALLQINSVGGFYIGGSAPRDAFGYQGGALY